VDDQLQLGKPCPGPDHGREEASLCEAREGGDLQHAPGGLAAWLQVERGRLDGRKDGLGMGRQARSFGGQAHPPPDALQQRHAGFPLQDGELLRHRRGGEAEGGGDGGHGAAMGELAEQPQAGQIKHQADLTEIVRSLK
jgi:hypothetical protein